MTKQCRRCFTEKPLASFYPSKWHRSGRHSYCIPCHKADGIARGRRSPESRRAAVRKWQRNNPDKRRNQRLLKDYGITLERYNAMREQQGGLCAVCGSRCIKHGDRLSVDHDHESGRVRGLLCDPCNNGLGRFRDDPALLRTAADYLERAPGESPALTLTLTLAERAVPGET